MYVKPQIKKLQMYVPGKSIGGVKLSSNENPFGASLQVEAVVSNFKDFARYPDGASFELKKKVAEFLKIDQEQLIFGAGADEVIQMISRSVLMPQDNIIQASPTFPQYEHHAIIEGADVLNAPLKNGTHDLKTMLKLINEKTKIIWICNPNNPTGTYVNKKDLAEFLDAVAKEILVILDEAYLEYVEAEDFPDSLELLEKYPNVVILRTFSKVYGLASFRVGYGIGNKEFIQNLELGRLPFNTGALAQMTAVAAMDDQEFVKKSVVANVAGRKQYTEFFEKNGIFHYPSQANFIFIPSKRNLGMEIGAKILEAGYIVRAFPFGIRITIGKAEDNEAVIACLNKNLDLLR